MVQLVDSEGHKFITRDSNIFVLGKDKPMVTLPSHQGLKLSINQNREARLRSLEKCAKRKEWC